MLSLLCDFQGPHLPLRVFKLFQVQNMFRILEHVRYWIKAHVQKLKGHINVGLEENNWVQNVNKIVREGNEKSRRITHRKLWTGNEKLLLSFCAPPHICNLIGQILSGGLPVLVPIFYPGKIQGSGNRYSPFLTLINNSMASWTKIMFCMYNRRFFNYVCIIASLRLLAMCR